ncbi:hypothetical protein [Agromyces sp. NPDC049794]|uniref:hypothetical protein n=1 Tax=unclassified Agromyces TaxID=2639701 RepID=UPI0033D1E579
MVEVEVVARVLDVPETDEVRAARAVLAASPRVAAALEEAACDVALRFDAAGFAASSLDGAVSVRAFDAAVFSSPFTAAPFVAASFEAFFAAVERGVRGALAGFAAPDAAAGASSPDSAFGARRTAEDPRTAGTPVPVPSGASSS